MLIFGMDVADEPGYVVWKDGRNSWWPFFATSFLILISCKLHFLSGKAYLLRFSEDRAIQELQNEYNNMGSIQLDDGAPASWIDPGKPNSPRNPNFWGVITFEPWATRFQNLPGHHFYTTPACMQNLGKIEEGEESWMFTFAWNDPHYVSFIILIIPRMYIHTNDTIVFRTLFFLHIA